VSITKEVKSKKGSKQALAVEEILRCKFGFYSVKKEFCVPVKDERGKTTRLFFDFFIEAARMVVEVQGEQHEKPNPFFYNGDRDYKMALERDEMKRQWCLENGVAHIEILHNEKVTDSLIDKKIIKALKKKGGGKCRKQ
jgi:very-short-patch-repair endonuclease